MVIVGGIDYSKTILSVCLDYCANDLHKSCKSGMNSSISYPFYPLSLNFKFFTNLPFKNVFYLNPKLFTGSLLSAI